MTVPELVDAINRIEELGTVEKEVCIELIQKGKEEKMTDTQIIEFLQDNSEFFTSNSMVAGTLRSIGWMLGNLLSYGNKYLSDLI